MQYNVGTEYNFYQIFGVNSWLWLFPYMGRSGKPSGSGVSWPSNNPNGVVLSENAVPGGEVVKIAIFDILARFV